MPFVPLFIALQYVSIITGVYIQTKVAGLKLLVRKISHYMPGYIACKLPLLTLC